MATNEELINKIKHNDSHSSIAVGLQEMTLGKQNQQSHLIDNALKGYIVNIKIWLKNKHLEPLQKFLSGEIELPKVSPHLNIPKCPETPCCSSKDGCSYKRVSFCLALEHKVFTDEKRRI